jgi:hypothetical protein
MYKPPLHRIAVQRGPALLAIAVHQFDHHAMRGLSGNLSSSAEPGEAVPAFWSGL